MSRTPLACLLATFLAVPAALAIPVASSETTFTVVSGRSTVSGGEEVCFRIGGTSASTERLRVRIRFVSEVPAGWLTLDGTRSASFRNASEELVFTVDPLGVHRLTLELQDRATIDWLSITAAGATITQETCSRYDFAEERRVSVQDEPPSSVDRFERERDRSDDMAAAREREELERRREQERAPAPTVVRGAIIPAGTELELTLEREISTKSAYQGQGFQTRLDRDVLASGRVALPAGSRVTGHVVESKDAGRFGKSTLTLAFDEAILPDGTRVPIQGTLKRVGKGSAGKQTGIIAGSAVGGAVLGKILGGDSDAALLGAIVGGSIAAGSIAAKEGESIVLPAGTVMAITIDTTTEVPDRTIENRPRY